ncbi:hypothetical protein H6G64_32610 [Calothrix sp. FACHB-156]|nr:hypothetical protein [Calothrix sp. FACHB-156]
MTNQQSWEKSLDPQLMQRLMRPLLQPGVFDRHLANVIIGRSQLLHQQLPLLADFTKRHSSMRDLHTEQVPIVYAQPVQQDISVATDASSFSAAAAPKTSQPMVIQAKFTNPTSHQSAAQLVNRSQGGELPIVQASSVLRPAVAIAALQTADPQRQTNEYEQIPQLLSPQLPFTEEMRIVEPQLQPNLHLSQVSTDLEQKSVIYVKSLQTNTNPNFERIPELPKIITRQAAKIVSPTIVPEKLNTSANQQSCQITNSQVSDRPIVQAKQRLDPPSQIPLLPVETDEARSTPSSIVQIVNSSSWQFPSKNNGLTANRPLVFYQPPSLTNPESPGIQNNSDSLNTGLISQNPGLSVTQKTATTKSISVNSQTTRKLDQTSTLEPQKQTPINIDALADKVERKLMRRLVVERERRGQQQWR